MYFYSLSEDFIPIARNENVRETKDRKKKICAKAKHHALCSLQICKCHPAILKSKFSFPGRNKNQQPLILILAGTMTLPVILHLSSLWNSDDDDNAYLYSINRVLRTLKGRPGPWRVHNVVEMG